MTGIDLYVVLLAALNLGVVIEVVRRRRMSEQFALLWLLVGIFGLAVGFGRRLIDELADRLGLAAGTSLVFSAAILFLLIVCIVLSSHVSRLREDVQALAEEIAFLQGIQPPPDDEGQPAADEATAGPGSRAHDHDSTV